MNFQFCILGFLYDDSDRMNHTLSHTIWPIRYDTFGMTHTTSGDREQNLTSFLNHLE